MADDPETMELEMPKDWKAAERSGRRIRRFVHHTQPFTIDTFATVSLSITDIRTDDSNCYRHQLVDSTSQNEIWPLGRSRRGLPSLLPSQPPNGFEATG